MTPESKTVKQSKAPVDGGGGEWLKLWSIFGWVGDGDDDIYYIIIFIR
jgi:hypothetical protein